ncbi:MAG: Uma2 family endonuclease, partial [Acidobacteriota bacterium]
MATPTQLLTFAEFEKLPDPREGKYELRHGEAVLMAPPKHGHKRVQLALQNGLAAPAGASWVVVSEYGFRPGGEAEYRIADVAMISSARWNQTAADSYFQGAPDLVIEVLSPSNTAAEMLDKRDVCLQNGAREFWLA